MWDKKLCADNISSIDKEVLSSLIKENDLRPFYFFKSNTTLFNRKEIFQDILGLNESTLYPTTINIFNMNIQIGDFDSFWCTFKEIFLYQDYFIRNLPEEPTIIDGGSHWGLAALFMKKIHPKAKIICFEPDPSNFLILSENLKINASSNIKALPYALYEKGEEEIQFYSSLNRSMGSSITPRMINTEHKLDRTSVSTKRLSPYLKEKVDFVKLDIEGVEGVVLKECRNLLKNIHYLFIEFHDCKNQKTQKLSYVLNILDEEGFTYQVSKSHSHLDKSRFRPMHYLDKNCTHVIYAKNEAF